MPPIQLYDLSQDVGEAQNLCEQHPQIVQELQAVLTQYILSGRSTPGAPQDNYPCENWPGLEWMAQK